MIAVERMPKSGYTMREGLVTKIFVKEGQSVAKGDVILEYETDKLTGTVESSSDGVVRRILAKEEESYPVLQPLVILGEAGEPIPSEFLETEEKKDAPEKLEHSEKKVDSESSDGKIRVFASPLARRLAREKMINLSEITGTGPNGRIQKKDVLLASEKKNCATSVAKKLALQQEIDLSQVQGTGPRGRVQKADVLSAAARKAGKERRERITSMRRTIAGRLSYSKQTIPHAYYTCDIVAEALVNLKEKLAVHKDKTGEKAVTYNELILFAVSRALRDFPLFTARIEDNEIVYSPAINLGMAVSVSGGLVVPVIPAADKLPLNEMARKARELSEKARKGTLSEPEISGGVFTVSNLGNYGIRQFSAIINPPEAGILAVGAIEDRVCAVSGCVQIQKMMTLTLSADHRLIDGKEAADFLNRLKQYLQEPCTLVL